MYYNLPVGAPKIAKSVSRFHRLLQDIVASGLSSLGFDVVIEEPLPEGLIADVYGESPWGSIIVEVETGFVDPQMLGIAEDYLTAKIAWKSVRYSRYADYFAIATPSFVNLPIPKVLTLKDRSPGEIAVLLSLLRGIMKTNGKLGIEDLMNAQLDLLIRINISSRSLEFKWLSHNPYTKPDII